MKKLIYSTLFTFSLLLFPYPVSAFTNNFNVTIDEELITIAGNPGSTYTTTINVETMSASQTIHLFGLSLPTPASYSASSWITPAISTTTITNQAPTTLTFTINIPSTTTAGEYYQAIAVADVPFSDIENADPTTLVAVPVIFQVSSTATESETTTTSSSSTSTSTTSTTSQTPTATTTKKITTTKTKKTIPAKATTPKIKDAIYSKLNLLNFSSSYNILKLQTIFDLKLKNDGNIYSIPSGSIQVLNLKNSPLKNIPLSSQQKNLLPQKEAAYRLNYKGQLFTVGIFKAKLNLTGTDSQKSDHQPITKQIYFFHISLLPLIVLFLAIIIFFSKSKNKKLLLLICILVLAYLALISQKSLPKYLSDTQSLNITAQVKTQIGLKSIINNDLSKTILFTNTNPLGSTLFSLQNGTRTSLDQVSQYSYGSYTTDLLYPQDSLPIMMITTGY